MTTDRPTTPRAASVYAQLAREYADELSDEPQPAQPDPYRVEALRAAAVCWAGVIAAPVRDERMLVTVHAFEAYLRGDDPR